MSKRCNNDEPLAPPLPKRARLTALDHADRLSSLSDELLLHTFSFLPIPSLLTCQRLSRRFQALAGDSELWKRQYYSRWVRPRVRRLATTKRTRAPHRFEYSPKVSTWLDHSHLARKDALPNWKRQYRLRHNWSKGICRVSEVEFPQPSIVVKFCAGFVFTADSGSGLRVWDAENPKSCVAGLPIADIPADIPTALTATCCPQSDSVEVAVGFASGRLSVYNMDTKASRLCLRFSHFEAVEGAITAITSSYPYLLMVSQHKVLSLFKMPPGNDDSGQFEMPRNLRLLASLKADSILAPMSLSLRVMSSEIISSVVYSFFHIGCGWSLGIQELHFNKHGEQLNSRLTTTVDSQYGVVALQPLAAGHLSALGHRGAGIDAYTESAEPSIVHHEPPTSVSYSHPYLLTSHPDNTLTVYLIVSTAASLFVKGGQRLWGHTSSVSAVQVSDRGKAISVSSRGDEVRIWELESLVSSFGAYKALKEGNGIQVSPENKQDRKHEGLDLLSGVFHGEVNGIESSHTVTTDMSHKLSQMRMCVGFDDERVLLLGEKDMGTRLLELYDFT